MFRAYIGIIRKEFLQVFRDPNMIRIIFLVPVVQLLLLGYAVNVDVREIDLDVYDYDQSQLSREFVRSMEAGEYFVTTEDDQLKEVARLWELDRRFKSSSSQMAVIIPEDFSEKLTSGDSVTIGLIADGVDANAARIGQGYAAQIVLQFSQKAVGFFPPVDIRNRVLYNPESESVYYMVPGIVVTLLTMITIILTSMAIVREREVGTLEQLLVTPISRFTLLMGKISTFAILGLVEMVIALAVGVLWFGIPFEGSVTLLFALSIVYLFATLGIGMFFSTITSTQQQAMFFAWFFSIFAILTSGFFTPIANMPQAVQYVTYLNPMRYFMVIVRGIMMKGAGVTDLWPEILATAAYGVAIFVFAISQFKKRTA